ncbi:MAG: hypothetical protein ACREJC_22325 [Tepidisphaeraceae bacterium]
MYKRAALILALWFFALGSGAVERLHNDQHAREDARHESPASSRHDDSNCATHAQLHLPVLVALIVPLLLVAALAWSGPHTYEPRCARSRVPSRIDCRGPPDLA